ncbi:MAG: SpoIIE family protein phosphatase [Bacteroidales bacterium]|nr:SpoIIE family protein phosphatase [Bacteroidales bacterium]
MRTNRLSFKIIIRILTFTILLGASIFSIYYYYSRTEIEKSARENAVFLAENTIKKIEEVIRPAEMIPNNLSWMLESGSIPKDSILPFLAKLVRNNPIIYASAIAFEPGVFDSDVDAYAPYAYRKGDGIETIDLWSPDYNYFIMDWYQIPAMLKTSYWSEPYYDEGGADALLSTYSMPFYVDKQGERVFGGIITIDISLEWLTEIVRSVRIFETGYAFLISRAGVYVTHPEVNLIKNHTIFTRADELNEPELRTIGRDMIRGEQALTSIDLEHLGYVWIYHTQLPSTRWSLGVVYPHKEMFAGLHKLTLTIILLTIFGLALLLFLTIRIINHQISPLAKFASSARSIASGDFKTELPHVGNSLEMQDLYNSFDYMKKELAQYIAHLQETTSAKEKIESELRIAKEIQMGMIPHIFPPFPDLPEIDLYATLLSAKEVGGDLYDFFLLDDSRICFAIGDVSGKGIPASLFMAVTRTLLRSTADKDKSTAEIVTSINKTLSLNNESNMFVTFFLGILDIQNGVLKYCNAGHNPPILIRNKTDVRFFNITKAIPVGLFEMYEYTEESILIDPTDQIFLYTDGLSEAEDVDHNLFGDEYLLEVIRQNASASPRSMIEAATKAVADHVKGHTQSDDLTMMSINYYGKRNL